MSTHQNILEQSEVISCYTRAQALSDRELVDVTETAKELYKYPTAITRSLAATINNIPEYASHEDTEGRLWDVLWMSRQSGTLIHETTKEFKVKMSVKGGGRWLKLWAVCGPSDDGSPCLTIGYPEDF